MADHRIRCSADPLVLYRLAIRRGVHKAYSHASLLTLDPNKAPVRETYTHPPPSFCSARTRFLRRSSRVDGEGVDKRGRREKEGWHGIVAIDDCPMEPDGKLR